MRKSLKNSSANVREIENGEEKAKALGKEGATDRFWIVRRHAERRREIGDRRMVLKAAASGGR